MDEVLSPRWFALPSTTTKYQRNSLALKDEVCKTVAMGTSITTTSASSASPAGEFSLRPGKSWHSYEQFRLEGGTGLCASVNEGQVGFLTVKGVDFAILRRRDFDRVYGLAQDVRRLAKGIPLLRQAAEIVLRGGGDELAIRHFQELTMTFPNLVTSGPPLTADLSLDVDDADQGEGGLSVSTFAPPRAAIMREETTGA